MISLPLLIGLLRSRLLIFYLLDHDSFLAFQVTCDCKSLIQVAIRNAQQGVFYFSDTISMEVLIRQQNALQPSAFIPLWRSLPEANESMQNISLGYRDVDSAVQAISHYFALQVCCAKKRDTCLYPVGLIVIFRNANLSRFRNRLSVLLGHTSFLKLDGPKAILKCRLRKMVCEFT